MLRPGCTDRSPVKKNQKDRERGSVKRKIGSGRLPTHGPAETEALQDYLRAHSYDATYAGMEIDPVLKEIGWKQETMRRWVKKNCDSLWAKVRPSLSGESMGKRKKQGPNGPHLPENPNP